MKKTIVLFVCLSILAIGGSIAAGAESGPPGFSAIPGSFRSTTDVVSGEFSSSNMTIEIVLAPRNQPELTDLLANVYNPSSQSYHHWLSTGEFYARFAPSSAQTGPIADYLRAGGLVVEESSSPFLLRASGSSSVVAAAFRTNLLNYRNRNGITYFSNASPVQLPTRLASGVLGVVGLTNTVRLHPQIASHGMRGASLPGSQNCETPYPTTAQLFELFNYQIGFPYGYGAGPGCSGLTPSQTNSIYGAPNVGPAGKGAGVTLAVFELAAYQQSDIVTWAQYFYGRHYTPPLMDINVDGGPLNPICPAGDTCNPATNAYSGDVEVDLDIQAQLTIAPDARNILVYMAPNDSTGQVNLDEYGKIANDNTADVISSSWGLCENDAGAGFVQAENVIFEQMALQGQSIFSASGDTGAFECIRDGTGNMVNVGDPSSQPWMTSVGGTSLGSFNPGSDPHPKYPPSGVETVWNVDNLCNTSSDEGNFPGLFWCTNMGAGGGGNSQFWGRPTYQFGPGVNNPYTTYGNGTTQCSLAPPGTPCREVPDVSMNADEWTAATLYCSSNANTPGSGCAPQPGAWFQVGGTSLASPLWSAIIGDHDGYWHGRVGNANPLLYLLFNLDGSGYFHDITGINQSTNNNGLFPTTPGYDQATGIGTPKMGAIITLTPQ